MFHNDSIFWIEINKIKPNPMQPRRDFNDERLNELAESIRQYGVLQPLVITRREIHKDDGLAVEYEIIAGERRLRASKIAGLSVVPAVIRSGAESDRARLELSIIENLQREDLNPLDRAVAFDRLVREFGLKHRQIARKISKSREYVANTIRILGLPDEMKDALVEKRITEGHTRALLMLGNRPEEQTTLFKEIIYKRITVRESEEIARRVAQDRVKKRKHIVDPRILRLEKDLSESLGTRVRIEQREVGGRILIDFFSTEEIGKLAAILQGTQSIDEVFNGPNSSFAAEGDGEKEKGEDVSESQKLESEKADDGEDGEDLYSVKNFTI